jgi:phage gpG-like protein
LRMAAPPPRYGLGEGLATMNLLEAIARMAAAQAAVAEAEHAALEAAAKMVETRAKGMIGHPNPGWPPLAESTLQHKGGLNMPLLETGQLRSSIESTVVFPSAFVGSNDDRAVWHETGTSHVPPRSFLAAACAEEGPAIAGTVAKTVGSAIGASLAGHSVEAEILKLAGEALHKLWDTATEDIMPDEHERERKR